VGLLTGLILLPLAPVSGVAWLAEQVLDLATQESGYDLAEIHQQLAELDEARQAGVISEEECAAAEDALVAQLMRTRRETGGLAEAGRV
jgi:predicted Zn-dependent peptidase